MKKGEKVKLLADFDPFDAGEIAYVTWIHSDGSFDLSNKALDYCPQDDCIPEKTAFGVPEKYVTVIPK